MKHFDSRYRILKNPNQRSQSKLNEYAIKKNGQTTKKTKDYKTKRQSKYGSKRGKTREEYRSLPNNREIRPNTKKTEENRKRRKCQLFKLDIWEWDDVGCRFFILLNIIYLRNKMYISFLFFFLNVYFPFFSFFLIHVTEKHMDFCFCFKQYYPTYIIKILDTKENGK